MRNMKRSSVWLILRLKKFANETIGALKTNLWLFPTTTAQEMRPKHPRTQQTNANKHGLTSCVHSGQMLIIFDFKFWSVKLDTSLKIKAKMTSGSTDKWVLCSATKCHRGNKKFNDRLRRTVITIGRMKQL